MSSPSIRRLSLTLVNRLNNGRSSVISGSRPLSSTSWCSSSPTTGSSPPPQFEGRAGGRQYSRRLMWSLLVGGCTLAPVIGFYTKARYERLCRERLAIGSATGVRVEEEKRTGSEVAEQGPGSRLGSLPSYSASEVKRHSSVETGIWVTFKHGVYDITEFVQSHPGGDRILLAAGGPLEPFWSLYAVHKTDEVFEILEHHRIGNFSDAGKAKVRDENDPYSTDPDRHPALKVTKDKPFNAETPVDLLTLSLITPNEIFFVRNHLPVPLLDAASHRLLIEVPGHDPIRFNIDELRSKFTEHSIVMTLQCAGNRRQEMSRFRKVKGLDWTGGAISTAKWTGVRLRDVLLHAGLDEHTTELAHVQFEGVDGVASNDPYGASIPIEIALNPYRDVIIAYRMNGEDIPPDHGYPLRLIAPGIIGARNVKWLSSIRVSHEESLSHHQRADYKGFNSSTDWGNADFPHAVSIQDYPVQSAIVSPHEGAVLHPDGGGGPVTVSGYAWSGGGNGIARVDVSADGGKTWHYATLEKVRQRFGQEWAWTLWSADIAVPPGHTGPLHLICKAVDTSHNVQPESAEHLWNIRGVLNNAWHRVTIRVEPEDHPSSKGTE